MFNESRDPVLHDPVVSHSRLGIDIVAKFEVATCCPSPPLSGTGKLCALADGSSLRGKIFVPIRTRLSDVLNDPRQFLPVESSDRVLLALAKSSIKHVTLLAPHKISAV